LIIFISLGLFVSRRTKEDVHADAKLKKDTPLRGLGFLIKDNITSKVLTAYAASHAYTFQDKLVCFISNLYNFSSD
jgi:Asp-tRNA(Asn)/Glu-tRNA(Gln) amidotransferase A subunit family amidase